MRNSHDTPDQVTGPQASEPGPDGKPEAAAKRLLETSSRCPGSETDTGDERPAARADEDGDSGGTDPGNARERPNAGRWRRGESGNPAGRPAGSRNRSSQLAETLLRGEAEQLMRTAVDYALAGEMTALKLCLERLVPPRRERTIRLALPALDSIEAIASAIGRVLGAVADGTITPTEGQILVEMLAAHAEVLKTESLERRVAALEAAAATRAGRAEPERKLTLEPTVARRR